MFKIILGGLLASVISIFLPSRKSRMILAAVFGVLFVVVEIIFIVSGGD